MQYWNILYIIMGLLDVVGSIANGDGEPDGPRANLASIFSVQ